MAEETEKSFPFDTEEVDGEYDRTYLADDFARYFRAFITSGVFMKVSTNLQVLENGNMTVILKPGNLIIDGYRYENLDDIIIELEPADGVLNRIDRISGTWSKEDRDIHYTLQKGKPSYNPAPPECRRDADTKDYVLADIYIKAGAISVTQADITDQRLNSEVCGVANPFNEIDTTSIFNQFAKWLELTKQSGEEGVAELIERMEGYLEDLELSGDNQLKEIVEVLQNFETMSEEQFLSWFNNIKGQLSEDAAGNLQNQITDLAAKTEEKINKMETLDFDDTGEVEGIESFTDFMSSFVTGTNRDQFLANLKAGLKYVLHTGQLVNSGMCETPGMFPLDAAYGKTLTDQITQLNSDLENVILSANVRYNPNNDYIEVFANNIWNKFQSVNLLFNGIYFNKSKGYNSPYLTGFTRHSLSYDSNHIASASSRISLDSSGRIHIDVNLTNKNENYSNGNTASSIFMSNQLLDIVNFSKLSIAGYFICYWHNGTVDTEHGAGKIKLYNANKNTVLMQASLNRGTLNTVNLNVAAIKEKVYLAFEVSAYSWGWGESGAGNIYVEAINAAT